MNYEEYLRIQTQVHGQIVKPAHYHLAERKAIDFLFGDVGKDKLILDVGCAIGLGMAYLKTLGYEQVAGIDLNPDKTAIARFLGYNALNGDISNYSLFIPPIDVIYCSHTFEHVYDPGKALERMKQIASDHAKFIFILPYVDTGDPSAHCASEKLGLRVDDKGRTVINWFQNRGLSLIETRFDNFREPEIWLRFEMDGQ